jgi:mRNA interferase RelE/StbE
VTYRLELETRALKELKGLTGDRRELISAVLDDLQNNPRPPGAKKLSGVDGWRVRKGDYRVLYTVDDKSHLIRIYRIGHRREVYRR